ncbi:MAG: GNAT family N-acetyltransferase [Deltaproteobacteria bacterium]|nr:GNAT family N-acetyltransferase [Deltaproteobacteria bacterium]
MRKYILGLVLVITLCSLVAYYFRGPSLQYDFYSSLDKEISDGDYHTVLAIHRDCFDESRKKNLVRYFQKYGGDDLATAQVRSESFQANYSKEQLKSFRNTVNVYVVREKQDIIGLFNCREETELTNHSMMVFNVCLKPSKRRKGLGPLMMKEAIEKCPQPGQDFTLLVYKDDTYVVDFYKKLNFEIISDLKEWDDQFPYFNKYLMIYRGP